MGHTTRSPVVTFSDEEVTRLGEGGCEGALLVGSLVQSLALCQLDGSKVVYAHQKHSKDFSSHITSIRRRRSNPIPMPYIDPTVVDDETLVDEQEDQTIVLV